MRPIVQSKEPYTSKKRFPWCTCGLPAVALFGLLACGGEEIPFGENGEPIVNGIDLQNIEYRSLLALNLGTSLCSGAVVAPYIIMTAAHCVVQTNAAGRITGNRLPALANGSTIRVTNAPELRATTGPWSPATVTNVLVHPTYQRDCPAAPGCRLSDALFNERRVDVALIRVAENLRTLLPAARVARVRLDRLANGTVINVTGYGLDERDLQLGGSDGVFPRRRAKESVLSPAQAQKYHNAIFEQVSLPPTPVSTFQSISKDYLLSDGWGFTPGQDDGILSGDSGGPVFYGGRQSEIVGVNSGGLMLSDGSPLPVASTVSYHARVSAAASWLRKNLPATSIVTP